jgi:hypothetical protein
MLKLTKEIPQKRTAFFWVITQRVAVITCRRFVTHYRPHLHGLKLADLYREGNANTKESQQGDNLMQDTRDHGKTERRNA